MSLFGALSSGVSGLTAQSSAMGAISDNITNVSTIGYKNTQVDFKTLVTAQTSSTFYSAGGVQSTPRQDTGVQGLLQASTSQTDIALSGGGYFIVNESGVPTNSDQYLFTRAGSFFQDSDGYLRNTAGFYLQGWPTDPSGAVVPANDTLTLPNQNIISTDFLETVNLNRVGGTATSTSEILVGANLPSNAVEGDTFKTDVQFFDSLGNPSTMSVNYTRTARPNEWDIDILPPQNTDVITLEDINGNPYKSVGQVEFTDLPADGAVVVIDGINYIFDDTGGLVNSATNKYVDVSSSTSTATHVAALLAEINASDSDFNTTNKRVSISAASTTTLAFEDDGTGPITIDPSGLLQTSGVRASVQDSLFTVRQMDAAYTDTTQLTFTANPTAGDTIVIDGTTYTFTTAPSAATADVADFVAGVDGVAETSIVTFSALTAGQSVTVGGLTWTDGGSGSTAASVAAAFASLADGDIAGAGTIGAAADQGAYSGTFTGWATGVIAGVTVTATSTAAGTGDVTDIAVAGTLVGEVTTDGTGVAPADTLTLTGTYNVGDIVNFDIGSESFAYTVVAADTTVTLIAAKLKTLIDAHSFASATPTGLQAGVTTSTAAGVLTVTGINGSDYSIGLDSTAGVTGNPTNVNQSTDLATTLAALETAIEASDPDYAAGSSSVRTRVNGDTTAALTGTVDTLILANKSAAFTIDASGLTGAPTSADGTAFADVTAIDVDHKAALVFDADGIPSDTPDANGDPLGFSVTSLEILGFANGAADMDNNVANAPQIAIDFGTAGEANGFTQFGDEYTPAFISQNGSQFGTFAGVTIGTDGVVTALFDNGETRKVYKLPIATFVNVNQLGSRSGNVWNSTEASGDPTLREADSGPSGQVIQGSLEASTVDIGTEFTKMIVVQRAFSAAAKIISTADEMLEELLRIKR